MAMETIFRNQAPFDLAADIVNGVQSDLSFLLSKFTEQDVALELGVSQQCVNQWKRGLQKPKAFSVIAIHEWAKGLRSQSG